MSRMQDLSGAEFVELVDIDGRMLCRVPATADLDSLQMMLAPDVARAAWALRLLDGDGALLAEIPTRHGYELQRLADGVCAAFDAAAPR